MQSLPIAVELVETEKSLHGTEAAPAPVIFEDGCLGGAICWLSGRAKVDPEPRDGGTAGRLRHVTHGGRRLRFQACEDWCKYRVVCVVGLVSKKRAVSYAVEMLFGK